MVHMVFNRAFSVGNAVERRSLDLWALASGREREGLGRWRV